MMNFLEALYGGQYYEIHKQGKDGNKGRLNANLFLMAMIILVVIVIILFCVNFLPGFNDELSRSIRKILPFSSGKAAGKILAIPLMAIIYFTLIKTVGSEENFKRRVDAFMQYPEDVKKKANAKLLTPFFILLGIVIILAVVSF